MSLVKQLSVRRLLVALLGCIPFSLAALSPQDTAILVIDFQHCFTEYKNGSLAVKNTNADYINKVIDATSALKSAGYKIFATKDWHPSDHVSFASQHPGKKPFDVIPLHDKQQVLWPDHCVMNTEGANLLMPKELLTDIVTKGSNKMYDSYSGFADDGGEKTPLDGILKNHHIKNLVVYGIATDYCVNYSVLDGIRFGYNVAVVPALSEGVADETIAQAMASMKQKGALVLEAWDPETLAKVQF